ncbi:hypothetical protein [Saliphagus infecundisoli]|uniref:DUF8025 domain-containing protein n=1 Tax=Saliphagus infecundisoli TaxID=1849069 RepID=A0ABD5QCG4_9EURY|nr:hypothetical protein [Saliphagus infecundisoli]
MPSIDPFADCELGAEDVLGTRTFENVLFTSETPTPVDVRTGETPDRSIATLEDARAFAADVGEGRNAPYVPFAASVESQIETCCKPYTVAIFYHFKATGSLARHRAYAAAYDSDAFTVEFDCDFTTGDLTITVERVDSP